jgi:type I restriction enzyme, R subunit
LIEAILNTRRTPAKKPKNCKSNSPTACAAHMDNPRYRKLSERLEKLKEQYEAGQLHSVSPS